MIHLPSSCIFTGKFQKPPQKRLLLTPKWTTAWHHAVGDASLKTHLQLWGAPKCIL